MKTDSFNELGVLVSTLQKCTAFNLIDLQSEEMKQYLKWLESGMGVDINIAVNISFNWGSAIQVFNFKLQRRSFKIVAYDFLKYDRQFKKKMWYYFNSAFKHRNYSIENVGIDLFASTVDRLIISYYESKALNVDMFEV